MHEQDYAIVKSLVPVAWADGHFKEREKETLEALLEAFGANDDEKKQLREYAQEQRTIDDIHIQDLSADDRRILLQHAVLISFADGDQDAQEVEFLKSLATRMKIPDDEAKIIMDAAGERAKKYLNLL